MLSIRIVCITVVIRTDPATFVNQAENDGARSLGLMELFASDPRCVLATVGEAIFMQAALLNIDYPVRSDSQWSDGEGGRQREYV